MRMVLLLSTLALVTACSQAVGGHPERSSPAPEAVPSAQRSAQQEPPEPGASMAEVTAWIADGSAADPEGFHTATRGGETTRLGEDFAFTAITTEPAGTVNCMTDARADGALACLVDLIDPPPRPADVYGEWQGGWVDFSGPTLEIGSAHADPGRFARGAGAELPYGRPLAFDDYRCRADPRGLFCVNYAHQSAVKISNGGVVPFGCLQQVEPPPDIGAKFSC